MPFHHCILTVVIILPVLCIWFLVPTFYIFLNCSISQSDWTFWNKSVVRATCFVLKQKKNDQWIIHCVLVATILSVCYCASLSIRRYPAGNGCTARFPPGRERTSMKHSEEETRLRKDLWSVKGNGIRFISCKLWCAPPPKAPAEKVRSGQTLSTVNSSQRTG